MIYNKLTLKDALKPASLAKIKDQIPSIGADGPEIKDQLDVNDYLVNIKYKRFALDGHPFTVHILIGQAPEQEAPVDAIEYKNLVGQVYNFVASIDAKSNPSGGCANCKTQAKEKLESTGQILLHENRHEGNRNDVLASMEPPDVIEFLKRNLHWRITDLSGYFVLKEHITLLKVAIVGGKADHYADPTKLSVYRDYKVLYNITAGQEGGAGPEHNLFANNITY